MKEIKTNDGKKGGWLVGKRHYDKSGKPLGGIKAIVTDAGGKPVELEGGEVIINREASKKHWKELSRINQSVGGGVAIGPPSGVDEDPEDNYEHGGKIDFNPNHIPNKWILSYAKNIKEKYPEIWKLGGNIFGNEAFKNLKRVAERGHWLDSEEWMYVKWRAYVARHQRDYRIEGVIAMLKWVDKVEKGWPYMKQLIEEKIKKIESKKKGWKHKMKDGGSVAQTPAPKKDQIKGSDVNKLGSSASTKSASSIKFDESTIESIKNKVKEHNEAHPDKKITLASAKAVVRRGMGAYSSSHRPTITGGKPNSRTAWGLARLNAFTYKIVHGKSKSGKYTQDDDLINELGYSVSKYHLGGDMTFDGNNPDIRYAGGGDVSEWKKQKEYYTTLNTGVEHIFYIYKNAKVYFSEIDKEWLLEIDGKIINGYPSLKVAKKRAEMMLIDSNNPDIRFEDGGELAKGIRAEKEHQDTISKIYHHKVPEHKAAELIAKDHLKEDPYYYSKLAKMEGKKYADGGLIDAKGQDVNVGDYGYYDGRTKEYVTVNKITDKLVYFTNDQGKYKNADRSNFTKYFTNKNIPKITQAQQPEPQTQKQYTGVQTGLPSTDPLTWNAEYKVGDRVKVRYNFSNDLGTVDSRGFSTKGFAQVDYFSILNDFIIKEIKVYEEPKRPENPSGKFYLLDSELTWEGKDLEPIGVSTITPQPSKIQEPKLEPTEPIEPIEPVKVQMPIKKKKPFDANADYETLFTSYLEKVTNITTKVSKDVLIKSALHDGKMLIDQILK